MVNLLDIVGQEAAVGRLEQALAGRRPHAYLFVGPEGTGRRTTAEALAAALLCESPSSRPNAGRFGHLPEDFPLKDRCGSCESCRMFAGGSHPDFQMVYKELGAYHEDANVRGRKMQDLGIPVIRSFLIAPANRRSARGRGKVFVVREAELMSQAAQNALLKTLEEPPPGVTIILLTESAQRLLPTTLSRCHMLRFGPLPSDFVMEKLQAAGVEPVQAAFLARFSGGSAGRAIRLAGSDMYESKLEIVAKLADAPAGSSEDLGEYLFKLADKQADAAVKASRKDAGELAKSLATRRASGEVLELLASAYRDALTLSTGVDRPIAHGDQEDMIRRIADTFEAEQLAEIISQLSRFEQLLWRNVNPKTVWANVAITCASAAALDI